MRTASGTCTTTSSSRCSTTCSASRPAAAVPAPARTATACSASTRSARTRFREQIGRAATASSPAGPGSTSTTSSPTRSRDYLIDAVDLVAADGHRLLPDYRFDPHTGLWRHHAAAQDPAGLPDLRRAITAEPAPAHASTAGDEVLLGQLDTARRILAAHPDHVTDGPTGLDARFEALRWFVLPAACLAHRDRVTRG